MNKAIVIHGSHIVNWKIAIALAFAVTGVLVIGAIALIYVLFRMFEQVSKTVTFDDMNEEL
jgi:hypothetical protein